MPRDLFGDVIRPRAGVGARSRYTVPLSFAAHTLGLAVVVVVPLLATDALPALHGRLVYADITQITPPPPPLPAPRVRVDDTPVANPNAAPTEAPAGVSKEVDLRDPVGTSADAPNVITGFEGGLDALAPPPPPPPQPDPPKTVRPGGEIKQPTKIHHVAPVYPAIAQAARVQGVVIVQATIGVDGAVVDATVLRSVPLLDAPALDAVRQWRFTPTRLNGQPVAVVMTVTVNFTLR